MNLMISSRILLFLLSISGSYAQDPPSLLPTSVAPSTSPTFFLSQNPTRTDPAPTTNNPTNLLTSPSTAPTDTFVDCGNTPGWYLEYENYYNCSWYMDRFPCDDDRVNCWDKGVLGYASRHCCKCKYQCDGQCNDTIYANESSPSIGYMDDFFNCGMFGGTNGNDNNMGGFSYGNYDNDTGSFNPFLLMFIVFFVLSVIGRCIYNCQGQTPAQAQREVQQTMTARRQAQRENNTLTSEGLTEEEQNHARFEQFVTKFYFQTVLPNKSNISADSLRNFATKHPDEEHDPSTTVNVQDDDDASTVGQEKQGALSQRLSSWRRPSAKDECCICLECYAVGETICAPITTECNHVFHEGCINEWLKKNDKCPLCRVELLGE